MSDLDAGEQPLGRTRQPVTLPAPAAGAGVDGRGAALTWGSGDLHLADCAGRAGRWYGHVGHCDPVSGSLKPCLSRRDGLAPQIGRYALLAECDLLAGW